VNARQRRTKTALTVTAVAGVLLALDLFGHWYTPAGFAGFNGATWKTGWESFSGLADLIIGFAVVAVAGAVAGRMAVQKAAWRAIAVISLALGAGGTVTAIAITRRLVEPPLGSAAERPISAGFVGLGLCLVIVGAALFVLVLALSEPELHADIVAGESEQVPQAVAPPPGNPRFELMDGLRAIAAFAVMGAHVWGDALFQPHQWQARAGLTIATAGVTLFFLLSGFLLFRPFVAAQLQERSGPRVRDYARRRALRILPAYWFAITVMAIWPGLSGVFAGHWWRHYTLTQVYWFDSSTEGLGQTWSLCVEMAFYIVLPLIVFVVGAVLARVRAERRATVAVWLMVGLIVVGFASRSWGFYSNTHQIIYAVSSFFLWFGTGMLLAVLSVHTPTWLMGAVAWVRAHPNWCWAFALIPLVLTYPLGPQGVIGNNSDQSMLLYVLLGATSFLLALPAVFDGGKGAPRRFLGWRPVAWFGLISYGVFLWHPGAVQALNKWGMDGRDVIPFLVLAVLLTTLCATFSYYVVERPFLALKDRRRRAAQPVKTPAAPVTAER
jgi:peptidoglycan/LPS O-acetylase OafA/YrhL